MKTCITCHLTKHLTEFYARRGRSQTGLAVQSECKKCQQANNKSYSSQLRLQAIAALGGCCRVCGFSDVRALQIDHVNGRGNEERRVLSQHKIYKKAASGDPAYQLLCANHNWIKKAEQNETPNIRVW